MFTITVRYLVPASPFFRSLETGKLLLPVKGKSIGLPALKRLATKEARKAINRDCTLVSITIWEGTSNIMLAHKHGKAWEAI